MTELAFVIAVLAAFLAGYKLQRLVSAFKKLQKAIESKQDKKPPVTRSEGTVVLNPYDIADKARMEHEEKLRQLNPNDYDL